MVDHDNIDSHRLLDRLEGDLKARGVGAVRGPAGEVGFEVQAADLDRVLEAPSFYSARNGSVRKRLATWRLPGGAATFFFAGRGFRSRDAVAIEVFNATVNGTPPSTASDTKRYFFELAGDVYETRDKRLKCFVTRMVVGGRDAAKMPLKGMLLFVVFDIKSELWARAERMQSSVQVHDDERLNKLFWKALCARLTKVAPRAGQTRSALEPIGVHSAPLGPALSGVGVNGATEVGESQT
jgi:hypothetical protein